jgi:hypothetical protein
VDAGAHERHLSPALSAIASNLKAIIRVCLPEGQSANSQLPTRDLNGCARWRFVVPAGSAGRQMRTAPGFD